MPTVNPNIIEWARSTAGLTVDDAALALGIASVDRLKALDASDKVIAYD